MEDKIVGHHHHERKVEEGRVEEHREASYYEDHGEQGCMNHVDQDHEVVY